MVTACHLVAVVVPSAECFHYLRLATCLLQSEVLPRELSPTAAAAVVEAAETALRQDWLMLLLLRLLSESVLNGSQPWLLLVLLQLLPMHPLLALVAS